MALARQVIVPAVFCASTLAVARCLIRWLLTFFKKHGLGWLLGLLGLSQQSCANGGNTSDRGALLLPASRSNSRLAVALQLAFSSSKTKPSAQSALHAPTAAPALPPLDTRIVWGGLFVKSRQAGEWALRSGLVALDDFTACEAFLMIGLPAVACLGTIVRSLKLRTPGLLLSSGHVYTSQQLEAKPSSTLRLLLACKEKALSEFPLGLSAEDEAFLRHFLLFANSDHGGDITYRVASAAADGAGGGEPRTAAEQEHDRVRAEKLKRAIVAPLLGLSISISQQRLFKDNFRAQVLLPCIGTVSDMSEIVVRTDSEVEAEEETTNPLPKAPSLANMSQTAQEV